MKCLSLWQPWASVIFETDHAGVSVKADETRGWSTNVRGTIAVHAAKHKLKPIHQATYEMVMRSLGMVWSELPFGCIVGTVEIVNCRPAEEVARERKDWQRFWGDYRAVGDDGKKRYAFELRNPLRLTSPIPCIGRQGFFEVNL